MENSARGIGKREERFSDGIKSFPPDLPAGSAMPDDITSRPVKARNVTAIDSVFFIASIKPARLSAAIITVMVGLLAASFFTISPLLILGLGMTAFPYLGALILRIFAPHLLKPEKATFLPDHLLPCYTILLPLHKEANMIPQLAHMMRLIDYPAARLEILVLLEARDLPTYRAAMRANWPPNTRIIIVPHRANPTKPFACNHGLRHARGDILVIYDAEDHPHPQQLREAAARFHAAPERLACLQAPLVITESGRHFLEAHFALEYGVLFGALLPTLALFGQALPLGGTSNHFRTKVLRDIGGWDSDNLTEDADLGYRLARKKYQIRMLEHPTYENAPHSFKIWFMQRTRWLSGHIQTWCVHMRTPARTRRGLGVIGFILFNLFMMTRVMTGPSHALFVVPVLLFGATESGLTLGVSMFSYLVVIGLALCFPQSKSRWRHVFTVITLPLYWLCLAAPAFFAAYRMATHENEWLKSPHKPGQSVRRWRLRSIFRKRRH